MELNEFLQEHGAIKSDNAFIFADDVKAGKHAGKYVIVGADVILSSTKKEIPCLKLQDTESKVIQMLSVWSSDRSSLAGLKTGDVVTVREVNDKVFLNRVTA